MPDADATRQADAHIQRIRALLAPFTRDQLLPRFLGDRWSLQFARRPVRLTPNLTFELRYEFGVTGARPRPVAYWHHLRSDSGRELLLYHWHPKVGVPWPHLHVPAAAPDLPGFARLHLPTKRLDWPEVVRLLREVTQRA